MLKAQRVIQGPKGPKVKWVHREPREQPDHKVFRVKLVHRDHKDCKAPREILVPRVRRAM